MTGARTALIAVAVSLAVHGAIAVTPLLLERPARLVSHKIRFKVLRPKPRPKLITPPRPEPRTKRPRPKVPRPKVHRRKLAVARPQPPKPSPLPSPVPPVFGATRESVTAGGSSFGVPLGNTVATDPRERGPVKPGKPSVAPPPKPRPAPVRVRVNPRLQKEVRVPYPAKARRLGIEGTVTIQVMVGADGAVKETRLVSGPGFGLDEAARRALLRFRFRPAMGTDGRPMPCWITYRYTFQIED
jgi:protein TonB